MPKKIQDLKEKLTANGRIVLQERGFQGFTMRYVAEKCGIGLGTAYNYFENKDTLLASIMLEDWQTGLERCVKQMDETEDPLEKSESMYACISSFSEQYERVWAQYTESGKQGYSRKNTHELLMRQLCEASGLCRFVVEIIIYFATFREMDFAEMKPYLKKLLS